MNLLKKIVNSVSGYLVLYAEVLAAIGRNAAVFFTLRWHRFNTLPFAERVFTFLTAVVALFTFLPWRAYRIQFGDDIVRRHGIYSDDFALILVGCIVASAPLIWFLLPRQGKILHKAAVIRYVGLTVVVLFALWNWINPTRIAATKEATSTWSFYAFLTVTFFWGISGVLGAGSYATPQNPDRS